MDYYLIEQIFGINNVTVLLLLDDTNRANDYGSLVYYNVTSPSQVETQIHDQERTKFQVVIPYNTQVNVSITARLCGQHNIPTNVQLLYSKIVIIFSTWMTKNLASDSVIM